MANEILLAVAGSGKTAEIVRRVNEQPPGSTSFALTYTTFAQYQISSRLNLSIVSNHETMGWFAFLLRHIVRPYIPALFPGIVPRGMHPAHNPHDVPNRKGPRHYFDSQDRAYSFRLGVLAKKILNATSNAPIRRLERIVDNIYIDEFQDLVGNDRVVLEALLQSNINIFIVGDPRQSLLSTARSDGLDKSRNGVASVTWAKEIAYKRLSTISNERTTGRFNTAIANFSDLIHNSDLGFEPTLSNLSTKTEHDGVFYLGIDHVDSYFQFLNRDITFLQYMRGQRNVPEGAELLNIGMAKGLTRNRVLIYLPKSVEEWLISMNPLSNDTASSLYVAVTRARYSVAFVVENPAKINSALHNRFRKILRPWVPPINLFPQVSSDSDVLF